MVLLEKKGYMNKAHYKIVYVVLVYKNIEVTEGFYKSLEAFSDYKVIIVNSFFNSDTERQCREMADRHGSDYLAVENKGYGAGNNVGIKYAMDNYNFDYLVISNSDIEVKNLGYLDRSSNTGSIYSPNTVMRTGKRQNPCCPYKLKSYLYLIRKGYETNNYRIAKLGHLCNRIALWAFLLYSNIVKKDEYPIFMGHGSFIIIGKDALSKLYPVFNDRMFLYNEELYLGLKTRKHGVQILYVPSMKVLHHEGASAGNVYSKQFQFYRQSYFEMIKEPNLF